MKGKDKCELLKAIRRQIAEQYGLEYHPSECHHKGECAGTCPRCDAELNDLQRQLEEKGIRDIDLIEDIQDRVDECGKSTSLNKNDIHALEGDVMIPIVEQGIHALTPDDLEGLQREFIPEKKKVFFKECPIAGWDFHGSEDLADELYEGAELALVRERNNKHDRNAVAVVLTDDFDGDTENFDFDFIIGYVPRTENKFIATMMDLGWSDAFTAELTTVKDHGSYADRFRMTIYLQSKEKEEFVEHEERIFAQLMDDESFTNFTETLCRQGYVYYRWGGFPPDERELPREDENVVLIHKHEDKATLYLMYVVAKDEHATPFLKNPKEELDMVDDCCPYVLTNVKGPVVCTEEEISFLNDEKICDYQPEGRLSDFASKGLKDFFKRP